MVGEWARASVPPRRRVDTLWPAGRRRCDAGRVCHCMCQCSGRAGGGRVTRTPSPRPAHTAPAPARTRPGWARCTPACGSGRRRPTPGPLGCERNGRPHSQQLSRSRANPVPRSPRLAQHSHCTRTDSGHTLRQWAHSATVGTLCDSRQQVSQQALGPVSAAAPERSVVRLGQRARRPHHVVERLPEAARARGGR